MNENTEIPIVFKAEQVQALLQLLSNQIETKGTGSMRIVLSIEDTLMEAVKEVQEEKDNGQDIKS